MEVLEFMNTHDDWEEILTKPPYCIKVRRDDGYILLKYDQFNSDFTLPIVRECRGAIFYRNHLGKYECVCRAFDKFGNYGESYAPEIDWNSALVEEKVDGSLIKFFYHNGRWRIATNGTIDAFKVIMDDHAFSFGDLVVEALGGRDRLNAFTNSLLPNWTYMFELVSPKNHLVVFYPKTELYYLGQRFMGGAMPEKNMNYASHFYKFGILCPKVYYLNSIEDCLSYVKSMSKNEEGFVIRDAAFNRIKLKSPEYLMAFHMNNNGAITTKRIIGMMQNNMIDDFMAYCPEYVDKAQSVINDITNITRQMDSKWERYEHISSDDRRAFAEMVKDEQYKDFLFSKCKNPELTGMDYMMNMPTKRIKEMIERSKPNGN